MLKIAVYTLAFLAIQTCYAQNTESINRVPDVTYPKQFISKIEIQVGPSLVFFRGDESYREHDRLKMGGSASLGFVHEFNSRVHLTSIFSYESKGSKIISYSLNEDFTPPAEMKHISNVTLKYVAVSLLQKYSILKNRRLFFGAGPYFGYILGTRYTSKLYLNGSLFSQSGGRPDPSIANKKYDVGLAMVAGFNVFYKGKQKGSIQWMYKKGMKDINQPMFSQTRTNSLSILLAIRIK